MTVFPEIADRTVYLCGLFLSSCDKYCRSSGSNSMIKNLDGHFLQARQGFFAMLFYPYFFCRIKIFP